MASIGAHTTHVVYMLSWANACHGGTPPEGSWEGTWAKNEFSEAEWTELVSEVEQRYRAFLQWFSENKDWTHEHGVISPVSLLPQVAYHLGAIRQLMGLRQLSDH